MNRSGRSGRDIAVLIGGIAAGILGSRLLPPIIAGATAAGRARRSNDPFELLISDHRQILGLLDQMLQQPADATARRASTFLMLKRKLGKHAMAEEDVVYPLLHGEGMKAEQSKELYDEHADIKIYLYKIEELLMSGSDWSEPVGSLRSLIQEHVEEEEQVVFPQLRQLLDEKRVAKVSGQISREEALLL